MRHYRFVAVGTALAATLALTACGGSSGGSNNSASNSGSASANSGEPSTGAAGEAAVKALYLRFFGEPPSQAASDLQDGSSLGKAIKDAAKLKGKNTESAKVSKVVIDSTQSPPVAIVTYSLFINGKPSPIKDATGQAVYVDGKWQFAKSTFCTLVSLGVGKTPPGCGPS